MEDVQTPWIEPEAVTTDYQKQNQKIYVLYWL